jgi:hypothetical protein
MAPKAPEPKYRYSKVDPSTINRGGSGGVRKLIAGNNIAISPKKGTGVVTVNSISPFEGVDGKKIVSELTFTRILMEKLFDIEKKNYDLLTDKILEDAKRTQREELQRREARQEKTKTSKKVKNSSLEKSKTKIKGISEFFSGLVKFFVQYKIVEWFGKPENLKKVQDFVKLFGAIFKFISGIVTFGVDVLMKTFNVISGGLNLFFDVFGAISNFVKFIWDGGKTIIDGVSQLTKVFEIVPKAISNVLNFFTNLIPNFIEGALTEGLFGAKKDIESGASESTKAASTQLNPSEKSNTPGKSNLDFGKLIGNAGKGIGELLLNVLVPGAGLAKGLISSVSGFFGGNKELPKLAKGGIVTKPTEAIVGEAGPEAILPLSKLGKIAGVQLGISKVIPKFMKLLTLPFTIVGAGILALISSSLSMIPGVGPIISPLLGNIASMFGIPPSVVKGLSNFTGAAIKSVGGGLGNIIDVFGKKDPTVDMGKSSKFTPKKDYSVRGLLANILGALISKNSNRISSTQTTSSSPSTPTGAAPAPTGTTPTMSAQEFSKSVLEKASVTTVNDGRQSKVVVNTSTTGLQKVTGQNPGKYYYDAYGNIYSLDKDEKRLLTKEDFNAGVGGGLFGAVHFFRNLKNGTVSLETHANASAEGWYDYAANAVREVIKGDGSRNNPDRLSWIPANQSKKFKDGFTESTPYGKSTIKAMNGTYVPGSGDGDKVAALLEPGEYVLNKNLVKHIGGPEVLDKYNFDMFPRFKNSARRAITGGAIMRYATGGTVIEYITGDRKHPAYRSDHGGGQYHDHLAFKSKEERDRAIDYLQKKGWYVGSKNDGRHAAGSYHYSNQAIDIPFYPNQSRKGVSDNAAGESALSSALRKDLKNAGFVFGGPDVREQDSNVSGTAGTQQATINWEEIAKGLGGLYKSLASSGPPNQEVGSSSSQAAPKMSPSIPSSSQSLRTVQSENNRLDFQRRASMTAQQKGGNVINLGNPNQVIQSSTTQIAPAGLGGTLAPNPLVIYPAAP